MINEAIILVGGAGKRLQPVVSNVPKPMAEINGKPFLTYLLEYLLKNGIKRVILSVGYLHEIIIEHFGHKYKELDISYVLEEKPLGTGGAIQKALASTASEFVLVCNGDTYFNVDLNQLFSTDQSVRGAYDIIMSLKTMYNFDRYGTVMIDARNKLIRFEEKKYKREGHINGGIYLFKSDVFKRFPQPEVFSLENDFLALNTADLKVYCHLFESYFIDIGIPEDYFKAQKDLPLIVSFS